MSEGPSPFFFKTASLIANIQTLKMSHKEQTVFDIPSGLHSTHGGDSGQSPCQTYTVLPTALIALGLGFHQQHQRPGSAPSTACKACLGTLVSTSRPSSFPFQEAPSLPPCFPVPHNHTLLVTPPPPPGHTCRVTRLSIKTLVPQMKT